MPNNELQEILGARFREHTHQTDEAVWNAIEAQLDSEKTNRKGIWFWIFNGIAATVLFGCMFHTTGSGERLDAYQISTSNQSEISEVINEETPQELIQEKVGPTKESKEKLASDSSPMTHVASQNKTTGEISQKSLSSRNAMEKSNNTDRSVLTQGDPYNHTISTTNPLNKSENSRIGDKTGVTINERTTDNSGIAINELNYLPIHSSTNEAGIHNFDYSRILTPKKKAGPIPIHLGLEFSYLKKHRTVENAWSVQDTNYSTTFNHLANNRQFEVSLFAQFDFTHRFSASFGLGYSHSSASFESPVVSSISSGVASKESQLHLFTLPIQTKFNFFSKKRIALNGGLTLQAEFGRVIHSESYVVDSNWAVTTTDSESSVELFSDETNFQQLALEPYLQLSFQIAPRISAFSNFGYRMYVLENTTPATSIDRLNYFNADVGLLFRLQ
ncbi:MAG: hypothetical protein AB8B56_06045 [Crocinitomicaceae bacterium]